jgi:MFS family permease
VPLERVAVFQALRNRGFRRLWSGGFLAYVCRWMDMVVLGWLVLELTDSYFLLGLAGAFRMAPLLVFGLFTGVIADKFNRRRIVMMAWTMGGLLYLALGLLIATGLIQYWHILVISILIGTCFTLDWTSRRALVAELVTENELMNAISLESAAMYITGMIGALFGGVFINLIGFDNCYYLMGGLLSISVFLLYTVGHVPSSHPISPDSVWRTLTQGFRYIWGRQVMVAVLAVTILMNAFMFPYMQLLPIFARDVLSIGPAGLGFLSASPSAGALVCALFLAARGRLKRPGLSFLIGSMGAGIALLVFSFSRLPGLSIALLVALGVGQAFFGTLQSSILLGEGDGGAVNLHRSNAVRHPGRRGCCRKDRGP